MSWLSWLLLAILLLLPVALAFVGDEPPDNSIVHGSGDGGEAEEDDPDGVLMAA